MWTPENDTRNSYQKWVETTGSKRVYDTTIPPELKASLEAQGHKAQEHHLMVSFPKGQYAMMVAAMGICGEGGEIIDILRKCQERGTDIPLNELVEEIGDLMWFTNQLMNKLGVTEEEVKEFNKRKLMSRHAGGYTPDYKSKEEVERSEINELLSRVGGNNPMSSGSGLSD